MIEIIYSNEEVVTNKSKSLFKIPRNIRQVGEVASDKKIYIEDYVVTYINQLVGNDYINQHATVLLGQYVKIENSKNIFISGTIEIKDIQMIEQENIFTNETWTTIYENIKKYFPSLEIVGWFFSKPGYTTELTEEIIKIHINNFAGQDKTLFLIDSMEKEEAFYIFENNELKKQAGYYIYYDKNDEMQNYMIEEREVLTVDAEVEEEVVKDIRTIMQEKKQEMPKKMFGVLYVASTALIITVLVIGVTMLNNYEKMKSMEATLSSISENLKSNIPEDVFSPYDTENKENEVVQVGKIEGSLGEKEGSSDISTTMDVTNLDKSIDKIPNESIDKNTDNDTDNDTDESAGKNTDKNTSNDTDKSTDDINEKGTDKTESIENGDKTEGNDNSKGTIKETTSPDSTQSLTEKSNDTEQTTESKNENKSENSEKDRIENTTQPSSKPTEKNEVETNKTAQEGTYIEVVNTSGTVVKYYTIKTGDTLVDICKYLYNNIENIKILQEMNNIEDPNIIFAGQKIMIP